EFLARPKSKEAAKLDGPAFVDYINKQQSFFKAEYSPGAEEFVRRRIMDARFAEDPEMKEPKDLLTNSGLKIDLPERFDAREKWPNCTSMKFIRDQSGCGSCWAVSTVSVMSDRACALSNGRINRILSDTEVLSCCTGNCGFGCYGGWVDRSFRYAWRHGISTGGGYREKVQRSIIYTEEYIEQRNNLHPGNETVIMYEIMTRGPVATTYMVYRDFNYYKGGVYIHTEGEMIGTHAVKIIGWGKENDVPYWLVANSWNTDWGENGYFRILRGENHCNIEKAALYPIPIV
ncbi:papain family cysteine protease, partial [Ancylostoma duodenale]